MSKKVAFVMAIGLTLSACKAKTDSTPVTTPTAVEAATSLTPLDLTDNYPSKLLVERLQQGMGAAAGPVPRALSTPTLLLIKHFEGWSATHYDDSVGYCTIGWGHLIALKRCRTLSDAQLGSFSRPIAVSEGEKLLEADTRAARAAVLRRVTVSMNDDEFGALSTFVFNLGEGNFIDSTLLAMVNRTENRGAAQQFLRWTKAKKVVQPGLVIRRKCEATLYLGELRLDANGKFTRAGCGALGAAGAGQSLIDIDVGEQK